MASLISERNLSLAWMTALEHLTRVDGGDVAVIVAIRNVDEEILDIRRTLDDFVARLGGRNAFPVESVSNTIFPQSLYIPRLGNRARPHLYQEYRDMFSVAELEVANQHGMYFQRMMAMPDSADEINQLEGIITRLQRRLSQGHSNGVAFELCVRTAADGRRERGFPCLSHVSLTLSGGRLHMTAQYRNQYFIHKAYGNYLGLGRLLCFVCREAGCEPGELVCVASHADAEIGVRDLQSLLKACRQNAAGNAPAQVV